MEEKNIKKFQKKLESEKRKLTKQLSSFAKKDPKIKGNWKTKFPFLNFGSFSNAEDAEERETYENLLPAEHALEKRLQEIDFALKRIEKGKYGKCEQCKGEISEKRLKIVPEARVCLKCAKKI